MMEPCAPRADGPGEVDGIFQTPWKQSHEQRQARSRVWSWAKPFTAPGRANFITSILNRTVCSPSREPTPLSKDKGSRALCLKMWGGARYLGSQVVQLVKNRPAMQETPVWFLMEKFPRRRDRLPTPVFLGLPGGSDSKNPPAMRDLGLIPGLCRFPWRRAWQPTAVFLLREYWTEQPGGLQSMGSQRAGHDRATRHTDRCPRNNSQLTS